MAQPGGDPRVHPATGAVEIRRSARRRRTVSAYRNGDRVVVLLPARLAPADEQRWVETMVTRLQQREARVRPGDTELAQRAGELSGRWLPPDSAQPVAVSWTSRQNARWGSCTPADRTIRISDRLRGVPTWVLDYVLIHELVHLSEPAHDERFWSLVRRYPRAERARGFLEGLGFAAEEPAPAGQLDFGQAVARQRSQGRQAPVG